MKPAEFKEWLDAIGQGFIVVIGAGIVDAVLCWFGKITGSEFVMVTTATVGVWIGKAAYVRGKGSGPIEGVSE